MPMVCKSKQVTINSSDPTKLVDADRTRRHLVLWGQSIGVKIGPSDMTSSTGFPLHRKTDADSLGDADAQHLPHPGCEAEIWAINTEGGGNNTVYVLEFCED